MNEILLTKDTKDKRYLLGSPGSASNYYKQIKALLRDTDLWKVFAEPVLLESGAVFAWRSPYSGKAYDCKSLAEEDQGFAKAELRKVMSQLETKIKTFSDPTLADFFRNCLEIPDSDNIFLVNDNGKMNVVITQWGFVLDVPGAEKGLIQKILEVKKVPMTFHVYYYKDGKKIPGAVAAFANVAFSIDGKHFATVSSDDAGLIVLDGVKEETKVSAYEPDDTESAQPQTFVCYENCIYDVYVNPKGDMKIQIVDQFDSALPGMEFVFEYSGKQETHTSDAGGYIVLKSLNANTQVDAYQHSGTSNARNNFNSVIYDPAQELYKIVVNVEKPEEPPVPQPELGDLNIKVLDKKGNVAANTDITIFYLDRREHMKTDAEGMVHIRQVPLGTKFVIEV